MIKRYLQNILFGCLLMLILCGYGNDLTDVEKELESAKKKGDSVMTESYPEGTEVFMPQGTYYLYDEEGRLIKSVFHNMVDDYVSYITYEYH